MEAAIVSLPAYGDVPAGCLLTLAGRHLVSLATCSFASHSRA
jgi:hypothetical protein